MTVSNSGYEVKGVGYSTQEELKQALIKLQAKEVRLSINRGTSYDKVSQALEGIRDAGAAVGLMGSKE